MTTSPSPTKSGSTLVSALPPTTPRSASSGKRVTSPRKTPTSPPKAKALLTDAKGPPKSTSASTDEETSAPPVLPPSTLFRNLSNVLSESCNPNLQSDYSNQLARFLRGDISKCEFQSLVLDELPPHAISIHNNLILSLLRSVLTVPPPPPPPPAPTTPQHNASSPSPGHASLSATLSNSLSDPLSPGLSTLDFTSHPLPFPRKRRPIHESADTRRTRTRKEAVALPKDDRDRLRRELMAMDPEFGTTGSSAGPTASGEGTDDAAGAAAGKKKKKSKRTAAALAATLSGDGMTPNANVAVAPNPFTCGAAAAPASWTSLGPGRELFGDPPLHGYAYPPTPPHSSVSGSSPDPTQALPLIATSRARHAEYMRLVHNMHICRVQGDLPSVGQLQDRMTCVLWEAPGGKVDKLGPGAVELMMFGLRTYLKEVVEGMVRVARVGEREEEVWREVAEQVQEEAQVDRADGLIPDQEQEQQQEQNQEQELPQECVKMDVDDKDDKKSVSASALALLASAGDGQIQSWSARSTPLASFTRQRSISTSAGINGSTQAPWAGKTSASIRRPSSFTAPPASAPIAPPLDSPTLSSASSLVRTHSSRSVASNPPAPAPVQPAMAPTSDDEEDEPPLVPRERVLTLNHLATALALEPVLAGDARHVADRVLAKLWHATPEDEEVARWRAEMRKRVRAKEDEAAIGGGVSE